jgi:hypothetical protein
MYFTQICKSDSYWYGFWGLSLKREVYFVINSCRKITFFILLFEISFRGSPSFLLKVRNGQAPGCDTLSLYSRMK